MLRERERERKKERERERKISPLIGDEILRIEKQKMS
jgi:hypothetical protein